MLGTPSLKARQHSQHGLPRSLDGAVDKWTHKWEKHSAKHKAFKKKKKKKTLGTFLVVQWLRLSAPSAGGVVQSLVGEL